MARSSRKETAEQHAARLLPEDVPSGWEQATLGDLAPVQAGYAFKSSWFVDEGIRLLRGTNIVPGGTRWDDTVKLPSDRRVEFADYELHEGDTVLAMDRPVISGGLKVARLKSSDLPSLLLQRVARFQPTRAIDSSFLYAYVRSDVFLQHIGVTATGTQLPHISSTDIGTSPLLLPPLNEQKRIVAKIDALTEKSREARQALDEVPALLDQLRQSILAAAFRGDLTKKWREQNPNVEPASVLLDRIRKERRRKWEEAELAKFKAKAKVPPDDKWKSKYVEPEPVATEGLPELPEGWCWASVGEVTSRVTNGFVGPTRGIYQDDGVPYLLSKHVRANKLRFDHKTFITDEFNEKNNKSKLLKDDVLLVQTGHVGESAVVPEMHVGHNCHAMIVITPLLFSGQYLSFCFSSPLVKSFIRQIQYGVTLQHLNCRDVVKTPIPLAPLDEQRAISRNISEQLERLDVTRAAYSDLIAALPNLDSSILAKAFRGELVPQDPNDEPASVLLERIRKEREGGAPKTKTRKVKPQ